MKSIYIISPETGDTKESANKIRSYCEYLRYEGLPLCPEYVFGFLDPKDRTGWYREMHAKELIGICNEVYVFADEVTELMIKEIRHAQKLGLPIHYHDADRKEIDYDALVINKKVGPGLRRIIAEANGETCCSGVCPYGSECCVKQESADDAEEPAAPRIAVVVRETAEAPKKSFLQKIFGSH